VDVVALLAEARSLGLVVAAEGDRLVVRGPRSAQTVVDLLREHKGAVLAALRSAEPSTVDGSHNSHNSHNWGLADAEAAYRAAFDRYWNALYDRAGAMLANNAAHLAELEAEYLAARDAYFAAGDALELVAPWFWDAADPGSGGT
jgi:hypothetical protein